MQLIKHNQRGDTIVEVLISIAIVGLVLATAYATVNRNTRSLQDAQERGQAVKLVQTQIEFMHSAGTFDTANLCFFPASNKPTAVAAECKLDGSGQKTTNQPAYDVRITQAANNTYTVSATWDSIVTGAPANVTIYYRP